MNFKESATLSCVVEQIDSILLLSKLSEAGIENELIKSPWELYLLFDIIKLLSKRALNKFQQIQY